MMIHNNGNVVPYRGYLIPTSFNALKYDRLDTLAYGLPVGPQVTIDRPDCGSTISLGITMEELAGTEWDRFRQMVVDTLDGISDYELDDLNFYRGFAIPKSNDDLINYHDRLYLNNAPAEFYLISYDGVRINTGIQIEAVFRGYIEHGDIESTLKHIIDGYWDSLAVTTTTHEATE